MEMFTDNTMAQFRTKLPREIRLAGDWEVGLCDISFPKTFTIPSHRIVVTDNGDNTRIYKTRKDHYKTPREFAEHINKQVEGMHLEADEFGRITAVILPKYGIRLTKSLREILGFNESQSEEMKLGYFDVSRRFHAPFKCVMNDIYSLYVYTDIIEPGIVGDSLVRLLDIIPIVNDGYVMSTHRIEKPRYVPVQMSKISHPKIDIMTDSEQPAPFITGMGRVIIKLHFKRVDK